MTIKTLLLKTRLIVMVVAVMMMMVRNDGENHDVKMFMLFISMIIVISMIEAIINIYLIKVKTSLVMHLKIKCGEDL